MHITEVQPGDLIHRWYKVPFKDEDYEEFWFIVTDVKIERSRERSEFDRITIFGYSLSEKLVDQIYHTYACVNFPTSKHYMNWVLYRCGEQISP